MNKQISDFLIVGGGIIGINIARALAAKLGYHTSTRNSGVLHAGFYYSTDSLKAKFCKEGNKKLTEFCLENKLPLLNTGKIVMPTNEEENNIIDELYSQGKINNIDLKIIDWKEAKDIEPLIKIHNENHKFLWSPTTKVGDPKALMNFLVEDCKRIKNLNIFTENEYESLESKASLENKEKTIEIKTKNNLRFETKYFINCAGLYADKIAKDFDLSKKYTILPFKGLYLMDFNYDKSPKKLKTLIYPVPPKKGNFFVGVHLTMTNQGNLKIGPTATPIFWRENYEGLQNFKLKEFFETFTENAKNMLSKKAFFYSSLALQEFRKYYKAYTLNETKKLFSLYDDQPKNLFGFPKIKDIKYAKPGIRAQLVNLETRELITDFIVEKRGNSIHLLNVVSPGWTCSLSFSEYVVENFI